MLLSVSILVVVRGGRVLRFCRIGLSCHDSSLVQKRCYSAMAEGDISAGRMSLVGVAPGQTLRDKRGPVVRSEVEAAKCNAVGSLLVGHAACAGRVNLGTKASQPVNVAR